MSIDRINWMQRLFPTARATRAQSWEPLVDVYRTPEGWLLKWDLAGVQSEDLTLTIEGSLLTVRGVRRDCCLEQGCRHYRLEIAYSSFERTIELPEDLERSEVATEFRQGMLFVRIQTEAQR